MATAPLANIMFVIAPFAIEVAFPTDVTTPVKLAFVASFPFNFCMACKIESVAATVPAPLMYPVISFPDTAASVNEAVGKALVASVP